MPNVTSLQNKIKKTIHCTSHSTWQSSSFAAEQKDQTHKYCLFGDWWKTNSQLKSSLPLQVVLFLHFHYSSLPSPLSVVPGEVRSSLQITLRRHLLSVFSDQDQSCQRLLFKPSDTFQFKAALTSLSEARNTTLTCPHPAAFVKYQGLGCCVFTRLWSSDSWKHHLWQSRTWSTRVLPSPLCVRRFDRCRGKVEADVLPSLTPSDVFADQPRSYVCVVTAQVSVLKHWELLTKRLFEHWLNISRSYKKQHGIGATVGKRGSPNEIQCTAITCFFPFCRFFFPVLVQINWTGFDYKEMCDLNA